jgi:NAD-dependent DNA ligase
VRLNRALEELEKVKAQLQEEKQSSGQATVAKDEYDQLLRENRKLDKQKVASLEGSRSVTRS